MFYIDTANATEEFFVRRSPLYEVVGQLGMWGVLINGIQMAGIEHNSMKTATWDGATGSSRPSSYFSPPSILSSNTHY